MTDFELDEPLPICAACDSWQEGICINRHSVWYRHPTTDGTGCENFFPDPKRWPDADHD